MNSIRSHLLIWQISALLVVALFAGALTFVIARRGFDQTRDYGLQQIALSVLRHDETPMPSDADTSPADDSASVANASSDGETAPDEGQFVSQIWSNKGALVFSSLDDDGPSLQPPGYHVTEWQDQTWRTYTVSSDGRTAQVAVSIQNRDTAFYELLPWVLIPIVLFALLLALVIHEAVKRALYPLKNMTDQLGKRAVSELHELETAGLPSELQPLAQTLNRLLSRLDELLTQQRVFLADAAHELNTPLAAIKLQAQLARRVPDAEREASLNELDTGIARAIHLTSQLLQLARTEPDDRAMVHHHIDWHALVRQAVIQLSPLAEQRGVDLGLLQCQSSEVNGDAMALRAVLDNLIDNALRYVPKGSKVDVELISNGGWATLTVADNGPGIAADQRERVMGRFVRLHSGDSEGSGLGLAIVQRILQAHRGTVQLSQTPGGGLTVTVRLPLSVTGSSG